VTYRIYDYLRRDRNGNLRELHTELALEAINFQDITSDPKVHYIEQRDSRTELVRSPYFTTSELKLTQTFVRDYGEEDSFHVYMCLSGACCFLSPEGQGIFLHAGESLVVPACIKSVTLIPDGTAKLLESYVGD
jgi:mannose-6-phosphate isomerase